MALKIIDSSNLAGKDNPIFLEGTLPISKRKFSDLGLSLNKVHEGLIAKNGNTLLINNNKFLSLSISLSSKFIPDQKVYFQLFSFNYEYFIKFLNSSKNINLRNENSSLINKLSTLLLNSYQPENITSFYSNLQKKSKIVNNNLFGKILSSFLNIETLTGKKIKNFFLNLGLNQENLLLKKQLVNTTQKNLINTFLLSIDNDPEMKFLSDKALNSFQLSQLESLHATNNRENIYNFVLPFQNFSPIEFQFFKKHKSNKDSKDESYVVNIHTKHDDLGELWLKTSLTDTTEVDLTMWATKRKTVRLALNGESELRSMMTEIGLKLSKFIIINSSKPNVPYNWETNKSIIDILA